VKALSITRPWSELILRGKDVENRTWTTGYRGSLLIHSAQSWEKIAIPYAEFVELRLGTDFGVAEMSRRPADHPTGIVGVADLVDVCSHFVAPGIEPVWPCPCGPWAMAGQYHWRLTNARRLPEPVPCRGALGLWSPPADVLAVLGVPDA